MFTRMAGWLITKAYGRETQHYYHENQSKSACGCKNNLAPAIKRTPFVGIEQCRLCAKCISINKIPTIKRKKDRKWSMS